MEWVFNSHIEIINFEFQRVKIFSGLQLERVLITYLSKIVHGRVSRFQLEKYRLVYWINVRE